MGIAASFAPRISLVVRRLVATMSALRVALVLASLLASSRGRAASPTGEGIEHTLVGGVGGAVEVELDEHSLQAGANLMLEWEAIQDWLELEIGASFLAAKSGPQIPLDLLVKKPLRLTRRCELMVGFGPEVIRSFGRTHDFHFGAEAALDLMFWPSQRLGLWLEPSYDIVARSSVSQGLSSTAGLLVAW